MLKSAYKNNKVSFICFAISIALLLFGFFISFFPDIIDYYYGYNYTYYFYSVMYELSPYDFAILISSVLSILCLAKFNNEKLCCFCKTFSFVILIACLSQMFFYELFCELFVSSELYFSNYSFVIFIANLLTLLACIFLLIVHKKNLPSFLNIIGVVIIIVTFFVQYVFRIVDLVYAYSNSSLFQMLLSFAVPLFFIGDLFVVLKKEKTPKKAYSSEVEKELYALKIKLELDSITKEEYDTKTAQIISKL